MLKLKTHFERIPLEVVRKIAEKESQRQEMTHQKFQALRVDRGRNQPMRDPELKFPEWQAPLQDVILEFDREKLREKMEHVETLIFERFRQLPEGEDCRVERQALNDALSLLRIIKRDKLGFPDWKQV